MMDEPRVEIIVEPTQLEHRFRYKCEGNGAGSILGEKSTGSVRTTPTIKIHNMAEKAKAIVVVSCVNRKEPYHPHPHGLVGQNCKNGVCVIRTNGSDIVKLGSVGVQCCRHQDAMEALRLRKELQVDPFQTGHDVDIRQIDLTAVRLCFQVFLPGPDNNKFNKVVKPVVTREIIDKRTVNKLEICRLSRQSSFCRGGEEIMILCDKAKKGDVQVRFFEVLPDGREWEAFGESLELHKQFAVTCTTPCYRKQMMPGPSSVWVQLFRPSDQMMGEPKPFQFIPNEPDDQSVLSAKRRKIEQRGININNGSRDFHHSENPFLFLSHNQHTAVPTNGLTLMNVVGATTPLGDYANPPPPYSGRVNTFTEDEIMDLADLLSASQPQVNFAQTGQQRVNLTSHTTSVANQNAAFLIPGVNAEQATSIESANPGCHFVNFAPTGQCQSNQRPSTSSIQADYRRGSTNHPYNFMETLPTEQRQLNVGIFAPNEGVNIAVSGQQGQPNNDVWTSQPWLNQTNPQSTDCPTSQQAGYILDDNIGKLSQLDNPFPAGTVIKVTPDAVEDGFHRRSY